MANPYNRFGVFNGSGTRELYEGDEYDLRGQVSLLKKDSSGNEIPANEEGQLFLITKCRDKVIEHEFDIYWKFICFLLDNAMTNSHWSMSGAIDIWKCSTLIRVDFW